jgi:hypothetical protein
MVIYCLRYANVFGQQLVHCGYRTEGCYRPGCVFSYHHVLDANSSVHRYNQLTKRFSAVQHRPRHDSRIPRTRLGVHQSDLAKSRIVVKCLTSCEMVILIQTFEIPCLYNTCRKICLSQKFCIYHSKLCCKYISW